MIGIGELLILAGFGWVISKVFRFGRGRAGERPRQIDRGGYRVPEIPPGPVERSVTEEINYRSGTGTPPPQQVMTPEQARDKKLAELRRRYVADELSVEEYEAELDKLMRS